MHTQQSESVKTYKGVFESIRLDFTPDGPPLSEKERLKGSANYPTRLAYIHVYLGNIDAAAQLPSGYLLWILDGLLLGLDSLLSGQSAESDWVSDPWKFDLRGDPTHNRVYITLHVPECWIAMQAVGVPLDQFGCELIRVAEKWEEYLLTHYREEMLDPELGDQYQRFRLYLQIAQNALRKYIS